MTETMKYTEEMRQRIYDFIRDYGLGEFGGATKKELCKAMGIEQTTFDYWQKDHPDFAEGVKTAKAYYSDTLERDLLKCKAAYAKGQEVTETRTEYIPGKEGEPTVKKQIVFKKFIPPNNDMMNDLLHLKDPAKYDKRVRADITGEIDIRKITGMTAD